MQWRCVPNHPTYEVSDAGHVRRRGKILQSSRHRDGYLKVTLGNYRQATRWVHHLVLEAFVGERSAGQQTRHLNGDPADNRLENLAWGSKEENERDKIAHGTHLYGSRKPGVKLTDAEVLRLFASRVLLNVSTYELALQFGVSQSQVARILVGKKWSHLIPRDAEKRQRLIDIFISPCR